MILGLKDLVRQESTQKHCFHKRACIRWPLSDGECEWSWQRRWDHRGLGALIEGSWLCLDHFRVSTPERVPRGTHVLRSNSDASVQSCFLNWIITTLVTWVHQTSPSTCLANLSGVLFAPTEVSPEKCVPPSRRHPATSPTWNVSARHHSVLTTGFQNEVKACHLRVFLRSIPRHFFPLSL